MNCCIIEKLIDLQPKGDANFYIDFLYYCIVNFKNSTIEDIWKSGQTENPGYLEKQNLLRYALDAKLSIVRKLNKYVGINS
jgi:hypothetical protein